MDQITQLFKKVIPSDDDSITTDDEEGHEFTEPPLREQLLRERTLQERLLQERLLQDSQIYQSQRVWGREPEQEQIAEVNDFKPIEDESEMIYVDANSLDEITDDLQALKDIANDMGMLIDGETENLEKLDHNLAATENNVEKAGAEIDQIIKLSKSKKFKYGTLATAATTTAGAVIGSVGGPLGAILGGGIGAGLGMAGSAMAGSAIANNVG